MIARMSQYKMHKYLSFCTCACSIIYTIKHDAASYKTAANKYYE